MNFVFTGQLESTDREVAQAVVKRYGGKVTGQPSSRTTYVVLGSDAGPKKMELIAKHKCATLDEDQFLELIRTLPPRDAKGKVLPNKVAASTSEPAKTRETPATAPTINVESNTQKDVTVMDVDSPTTPAQIKDDFEAIFKAVQSDYAAGKRSGQRTKHFQTAKFLFFLFEISLPNYD